MIGRLGVDGHGRILVDLRAAFFHCQIVDIRVFGATLDHKDAAIAEASRRDPIGNAVAAAGRGELTMTPARSAAMAIVGLTEEEFDSAVMARARADAANLGGHAAERLLSEVGRALEDGPRLGAVAIDD